MYSLSWTICNAIGRLGELLNDCEFDFVIVDVVVKEDVNVDDDLIDCKDV